MGDVIERLPVDFHVRIDEVIQRRTLLRRLQRDVTAEREQYSMRVMGTEEVFAVVRTLVRLRGSPSPNPNS